MVRPNFFGFCSRTCPVLLTSLAKLGKLLAVAHHWTFPGNFAGVFLCATVDRLNEAVHPVGEGGEMGN